MKLQLALKAEYFDAIRDGAKLEEYRLANEYWGRRLHHRLSSGQIEPRKFSGLVLTKGYPKRGDPERTLDLPWRGFIKKTITHPHFGSEPVFVFAIDVAGLSALDKERGE